MSVELYGLRRCRKTQKAIAWLEARNISFNFHDFRRQGIDKEKLATWIARLGYSRLLNTKSPLLRRAPLSLAEAESTDAQAHAQTLMQAEPRLINRPVLECQNTLLIGFEEEQYAAILHPMPLQ
jgi:Spx/MgsR family transcriptional regulator